MKILKNLCFIVLVAILFCFVALRTPFVQRNLAIRYLKKHFEEVYLEKLSIGPRIAKIKRLSVADSNLDFKVEDCTIKWSMADLLFLKEIKIKDIIANGALISYHESQTKHNDNANSFVSSAARKIAYTNLKSKVQNMLKTANFINKPQLPVKATIDHLKLNCMVDILEYVIADVTVEGEGFAPLSTAVFDIDAILSVGAEKPLTVNFDGKAKIEQTSDLVLKNIQFDSKWNFRDEIDESNKIFDIHASSTIGDLQNVFQIIAKEENDNNSLLDASVVFDKKNTKLSVCCKQDFDLVNFACLFKQQNQPKLEISTNLNGEFDLNTWNGLIRGSMNSNISKRFGKIVFPGIKTDMLISCNAVFQMTNGTLSVNTFDSMFNNSDSSINVLCYLANPLIIWDKSKGFLLEKNIFDSGKNLFTVMIKDFNPSFVLKNNKNYSLDSKMSGQFFISSKNGNFSIKSSNKDPLSLKSIVLNIGSKKYLENTQALCDVELGLGDTTKISLYGITVSDEDGKEMLSGSINASYCKETQNHSIDCYTVFKADEIAKLPLFAKNVAVKSGIFSCHLLSNKINNSIKGEVDLKIKSFALDSNTVPINAESKATFSYNDENFQIYVPLDIIGAHNTSAYASLEGSEDSNSDTINAKLEVKGDSISIPEIQSIAEFAIAMMGQKHHTLISKTSFLTEKNEYIDLYSEQLKKRQSAAWSNTTGKVIFGLKKIFVTNSFVVDNFECLCAVTEDKIDLKTVNFNVGDSPFNAFGHIQYLKDTKDNPYLFQFDSTFEMNDIAGLCKSVAPYNEPAISGSGHFFAKLKSETDTVSDILSCAKGTIHVDCNNGSLRLSNFLNKKNHFILDSIWATSAFFSQKNERSDRINSLISSLQHVGYDSINIEINRDKDLDILLKKFDIVGPEIHASATGKISHSKYKGFLNHPIHADIMIEAAGNLGNALDALGFITNKSSKTKYMQGPSFILGGTVGRPDYSDFSKILYSIF